MFCDYTEEVPTNGLHSHHTYELAFVMSGTGIFFHGNDKYSIKRGIILSGDSFIHKGNYKSTNVYTSQDCLSCEMEAAAVGQVCYTLKIPFVVIRSISDLIFENIDEENNDNNFISSSTNSALVLLEYLK